MFGVMPPTQTEVVRAAAERARLAGAPLDVMAGALPDRVLRESDVVLAMEWPPSGEPPAAALAAMAAGKPVIAFETETSAGWPALDPQTWRLRGHAPDAPIAVTVDPRDHEHSLVLAMRRLAGDSALRSQLGAAARAWWQAHATVQQSATAWHALLAEALTLAPPARPQGWPAHLSADGTERARALVEGLGVSVDFLHSDTRAD
jgi:hypothetical protein